VLREGSLVEEPEVKTADAHSARDGGGAMAQPEPTRLERWVGEGGLLVDLLLPRTDAGVLLQAVLAVGVLAVLLVPARRAGVVQLWLGSAVFTAGLFMMRAAH
jgi:hypothetical protein